MLRNDATLTLHRDILFRRRLASAGRVVAAIAMGLISLLAVGSVQAGEADLAIPDLHNGKFATLGGMSAWNVLFYGAWVIVGTLGISLYQLYQIKKQPAHQSMLDIAEIIFQTCKTYLIQQGKFLLMLFVLIACAISYYILAPGGAPEAAAHAGAAAPLSNPVTL